MRPAVRLAVRQTCSYGPACGGAELGVERPVEQRPRLLDEPTPAQLAEPSPVQLVEPSPVQLVEPSPVQLVEPKPSWLLVFSGEVAWEPSRDVVKGVAVNW